MNGSSIGLTEARETFDQLLGELRPRLHRYCARMTGSVIDGEDVLQDALIKAVGCSASLTMPHSITCGGAIGAQRITLTGISR